MATTGFRPIMGSPTRSVNYITDGGKTRSGQFVSGINCSVSRAAEEMKAVQKRFGMRGTNSVYHGFQSFLPGEVTPEEAHQIGVETAGKMWGGRYQVVVATHQDTTAVHNHFVANAVSFRDGKKFKNRFRDHYRLRAISDSLCRKHGLSVPETSHSRVLKKGIYWIHRNGGQTRFDILKQDIGDSINDAPSYNEFLSRLKERGYSYSWDYHSVWAPGWERDIPLESLGISKEDLWDRIEKNMDNPRLRDTWESCPSSQPTRLPLLELEKQLAFSVQHSHDPGAVLIDVIFLMIVELLMLTRNEREGLVSYRPLSPSVRMELPQLDRLQSQYLLLSENHIRTPDSLNEFIENRKEKITDLEKDRRHCRNRLRRPKEPQIEAALKEKACSITEQLKPLRKELASARKIAEGWPRVYKLLATEHSMEAEEKNRSRARENDMER